MKTKWTFLVALAAFCGTVNAATMTTYDTPPIAENKNLISSQLSWLTHDLPAHWDTSKINFSSVFGVEFNAGLYDVRVVELGSNFGMVGEQNLGVYNAYGVAGSMQQVLSGVSTYAGRESYITYDANEPLSLFAHSHVFNEDYDIFNSNSPAFAWTTAELETQYYIDMNGQQVLMTDTLTTLLVGFDDSPAWWDSDYNDIILGIQLIPKTGATSGQPLPGVMAALLLGGGALAARRRKKANAAK